MSSKTSENPFSFGSTSSYLIYGGRELPLKILKFVGIIFVFFFNFDLLLIFLFKIKVSESEM